MTARTELPDVPQPPPSMLDRLAEMMLEARRFSRSVDRLQRKYVSVPSIRMAYVQNMRSLLGGLIHDDMADAELITDYFQQGKIHFRMATGEEFVVKSDRFRQREMKAKVDDQQIDGWDGPHVERFFVTAIFYEFRGDTLVLKRARTEMVHESGSWVYYLLEPVQLVGEFHDDVYEDADADASFHQFGDDDFYELDEGDEDETGSE